MAYNNGHPMLFPKDSGMKFGDLTDEEVKNLSLDLTETEKKLPHAKYYYQMPAPLPKAHKEAIAAGPIDPVKAFSMHDYGKFMNNTGHCEIENGYCVLPNGVTYAAAMIRQEGRTDEMVDFYNKYFAPEENLFYKTWNPGSHYLHYTDGCVEDFGFGRLHLKSVSQIEPEHLGINPADIEKHDPACICICGSTFKGYNLDSAHPDRWEWFTVTFYHRLTGYGREMRIRLWCGMGIEDGQYRIVPPLPEEAPIMAKETMKHAMQEYTNDHYLQTAFWRDNH